MSTSPLRSQRALFVAAFALFSLASSAHAQVLCPVGTYLEDPFKLELSGSAELRTGNTNAVLVNAGLCSRLELNNHYLSFRLNTAFGEANTMLFVDSTGVTTSERFVNAVRIMPQYRYEFMKFGGWGGLRGEGLINYDRDEFRRHEHLLQMGGGPNVSFLNTETLRLNFTLAYLFEFEKFSQLRPPTDPDGPPLRDTGYELNGHKAHIAMELGWDIGERVFLGEEWSFQVPLDHCACDTRAYLTTSLRVYGTDWLALEMQALAMWDAAPAVAVGQFDAIIRSGFVFSL